MPLDSFIDAIRHRFRRRKARPPEVDQQPPSVVGDDRLPAGATSQQIHGHFSNAQNFILNNATVAETINYINHTISSRTAVLELLGPYTRPDAAMDSSARYPPPTCHAETRCTVRNKLKRWLYNPKREWRMIWLHGPAGTGKSAVAQTFAECCTEWGRLGAAYFFSRTANRNKPETVVPSLVYQLAVTIPEYKAIIATELANDPQLLDKAPPVQFRKLIIAPFSALQRQRPVEPILVILDGLDECEGPDAQVMIIDMIAEAMRLHQDLPLLWLICSRPEVHLKQTFSRMADCGREELVIDAECHDDVKRYLQDGIEKIKAKYEDVTPAHWPSEAQLKELIDTVSGFFILASTILSYMGDPTCADPVGQLDDLMTFMKSAQAVGSRSPLAALDLLYLRILGDLPSKVFPITQRILADFTYLVYRPNSAQAFCNFLRLDKHIFYGALRGLHSVINVPEPADAARMGLRFHHASFRDFLVDPNRSGKFVIEEQKARVDIAKLALYWYDIHLGHFHPGNEQEVRRHNQRNGDYKLPGLTWTSPDNEKGISVDVLEFAHGNCWRTVSRLSLANMDEELLAQIYNTDFRYHPTHHFSYLANWFYKQVPLNTFVRTKPSGPTDFRLLEYFNLVIKNGIAKPAKFPLFPRPWTREYYFIGHGIKSAIVWTTVFSDTMNRNTVSLNADKAPSDRQLSLYHRYLHDIGWDSESVRNAWGTGDDGKRGSGGRG